MQGGEGASSQQPWGPRGLSEGGQGGGGEGEFSSPTLLLGGAGPQPPCQARGSSRMEQPAATGQPSPGHTLPRHRSIARCLNRHLFLSSQPAQPCLGHPTPSHPTPSKLQSSRRGREGFSKAMGGSGTIPAPGQQPCPIVAPPPPHTTCPGPSPFLLSGLPPATCLQGTIFCNLSATPEPLASSHNLGCHFL